MALRDQVPTDIFKLIFYHSQMAQKKLLLKRAKLLPAPGPLHLLLSVQEVLIL